VAGEKENGRGEGEWQGRRRRGKLRVSAGEESFTGEKLRILLRL